MRRLGPRDLVESLAAKPTGDSCEDFAMSSRHSRQHNHNNMPDTSAAACSMNMLWNNQVVDVCVVFESWHIYGPLSMLISCMVVAGMSYSYYHLLSWMKAFDRRLASQVLAQEVFAGRESSTGGAASGSSTPLHASPVHTLPTHHRFIRASFSAFQVFLSFFLMLVAMTYNSYLIGAIIAGAFLGSWRLERELDLGRAMSNVVDRGLSCH